MKKLFLCLDTLMACSCIFFAYSFLNYMFSESDFQTREIHERQADNVKEIKQRYVVTFEIRENHFTLDIGTHLKDSLNAIKMEIPVDKEFYDSVKIGDVMKDDFKTASLILKGKFGRWSVKIVEKKVVQQR